MIWYHGIAYFFGGLFLANAIPHWVCGAMGRPFQSPFATPPGQGNSSSTVNVLWGAFNLAIGYFLLCRVGSFDLRNITHAAVAGLAATAGSIWLARNFGQYNGGNQP
jgi:hypothetical protein